MRRYIGAALVALPMVALMGAVIWKAGFLAVLIPLSITLLAAVSVATGLYMMDDNAR